MKIWYEFRDKEVIEFSLQTDVGDAIIPIGRSTKAQAVPFLKKIKARFVKKCPEAFDYIIDNIKKGKITYEDSVH
jgi:hypothetical protein